MNASSWKKAADLVAKVTPATPQAPAAATVESQNLQSLPLSALLIDDSRPLQVTYDPQKAHSYKHTKGNIYRITRDIYRSIPSDTTRYEFSIIPHTGS